MAQDNSQVLYSSDMEAAAFPGYHQLANIVMRWEDKVLLLHRLTEPFKGFWSAPGGGVNKGEKYVDAARRELNEEVGLNPTILKPLYIFVDHLYQLESHIYSFTSPDGTFLNQEPNEHDIVAWKSTADAMKLRLTPGVYQALERLSQAR